MKMLLLVIPARSRLTGYIQAYLKGETQATRIRECVPANLGLAQAHL